MEIYVTNLVLEITRRCNMYCEHCLRGDAQSLDIDCKTLEYVAKYIQPCSITFTGGEPSLNIRAIREYFKLAEEQNHFPASFFIVTNGKENQQELAVVLLEAYPKCDDKEYCGIDVSQDIFHEDINRNNSIFTGLSFYHPEGHVNSLDETYPKWVINEGHAVDTGWGTREPIPLKTSFNEIIEDANKDRIYIDELYVAANGFVASDCNASYENIDKNHICHISELQALAKKYLQEQSI